MLRAIMTRRTIPAYVALFNFIKFIMPRFQPTLIMCDFEEAEQVAWSTCFPEADVQGCLWHYAVVSNITLFSGIVFAEPTLFWTETAKA